MINDIDNRLALSGAKQRQAAEDRIAGQKEKTKSLPYPWCYTPEKCSKLGYCPRDPNCGE